MPSTEHIESKHGGLIEMKGRGVLVTGRPGTGKSSLLLELVRRGHRLISDDLVMLYRDERGVLWGRSPESIHGLLMIGEEEPIEIVTHFGADRVGTEAAVDLYIDLGSMPCDVKQTADDLEACCAH